MTAYASGARVDGLFEQARAKVSLEDFVQRAGVKLIRSGQEQRGPCVLCDGGGTRFAIKGEKWRCYSCEPRGGDIVDLVVALRRLSPVDAAKWLLGSDLEPSAPRERPRPANPTEPTSSAKIAAEIWAGAKPFAGTLGERYLLGRGICAEVVAMAALNLRYHPFAKHHWDSEARSWITAPAMVAQVVTPTGPTGGIHVTYLDRATAKKAALDPAKRMWGPQTDAEGRPGCAWLIGPDGDGALAVSEGIETGLSVATLSWRAGIRHRVASALSLNRLQGGWLRDQDGCMDPFRTQPDPTSPAFTWPMPADTPWPEVIVAVDRDMHELKVKVRTGRGKACTHMLEPEARARICGRLAVAAWKAAGAPKARAIAPSPGLDFNDELRRVLAQESAS